MLKYLIYGQKPLKMGKSGHISIRMFAKNVLSKNSIFPNVHVFNIFP